MEVDKTIGAIGWIDIAVPDAANLRDFYEKVVGWKTMGISMGDYEDYCMMSPSNDQVRTGICHARGANAYLPAQWMIYINVADLDESVEQVKQGGGKLVGDIRSMGPSRYCVIQDPAGAHVALFQHG